MLEMDIKYCKEPELSNVTLIEGLPGVGNVGKIAADYLADHEKAEKFAEIYSRYFPPQVLIDKEGVVKLVRNELWYLKRKEGDIVFLLGDNQAVSSEGQYLLAEACLEALDKFDMKYIFTLGGYGIGKVVEKPRVLGAATDKDMVKRLKDLGVEFSEDEPANGIVGASGLLLGLGKLRGISGACLMGETSGYLLDPKSAKIILDVLGKLLGMKIDMSDLDEKVDHLESITDHLKSMEKAMLRDEMKKKDLNYIG